MRYKKKPVTIEAVQVKGPDFNGKTFDGSPFNEVPHWLEQAIDDGTITVASTSTDYAQWDIHTLEGVHRARPGDYIIRGVQGELYPCKPDIFKQTYEPETSLEDITEQQLDQLKQAITFNTVEETHHIIKDFFDMLGITNTEITWVEGDNQGSGMYIIKSDDQSFTLNYEAT